MAEIWKELVGNRETYLISNFGNVKTKPRNGRQHFIKSHPIKIQTKENGYQRVVLSLDKNGSKYYYVHRLVAMLFIPNPNKLSFVNHKDGNKTNNCVDNLEWCTRSENEKHAWRIGLKSAKTCGTKGEKHGMHKLTQEQVDYIRRVHKKFDSKFGSKALAQKFNVCPQTITNIVNYQNWKG
mgnify:CR=1 FL=1